jgi:NADPH-dependent glutamate synthase beta subunit-like oxidoreductase
VTNRNTKDAVIAPGDAGPQEGKRMREVVVVGGGLAGLTAALDAAKAGAKVYLVEEAPSLGSRLLKKGRLVPWDVPSKGLSADLVSEILANPNIKVLTNAGVEGVSRNESSVTVRLKCSPLRVNEKCDACGVCLQVCPIKPYDTFNEGLALRTAIDFDGPRREGQRPGAEAAGASGGYNIEKETPACQERCPVHIDIRRYVGLIAGGEYEEAINVIRERNPLPAVCGRVCNHPCETACNRGRQDEPVAIDALKRFAADYETALRKSGRLQPPRPRHKDRGIKVAVVGAGPAGLTVAHDLAMEGFRPTVFESSPVPGGMLWLCIPEYRLPRDIILNDVSYIEDLGVEIRYDTPVSKDLTVDDLMKQGFKAVFVGVGAQKGLKLKVPGEDEYAGFVDCIDFLRKVNLGDKTRPGNKVVVIGGGNSAIDSARTALRLGCEEVSILYRRTRREMPANPWEVDEAEREGVKMHYLAAPVGIAGESGRVKGMICTRMQLGALDASGRRSPVPVEGSEFEVEADLIIPAISQQPDLSFLGEGHGFEISKWNSFVVDESTMATNRPGVYAGGDDVTGPATVIEAIRSGHIAADSIREYLS